MAVLLDDLYAAWKADQDTYGVLTKRVVKTGASAGQTKTSQQALQARDRLVEHLLDKVEILLPESAVDAEVAQRVGDSATAKAKKEARAEIEKEFRTEILAEAIAKKLEVQVSQQELIDYALQMSQTYGMDISQLFSNSAQLSAVVADLGRAKALIEMLRLVTVKDTAGADVDLSAFLGEEAPDAEEEADEEEAGDEE